MKEPENTEKKTHCYDCSCVKASQAAPDKTSTGGPDTERHGKFDFSLRDEDDLKLDCDSF